MKMRAVLFLLFLFVADFGHGRGQNAWFMLALRHGCGQNARFMLAVGRGQGRMRHMFVLVEPGHKQRGRVSALTFAGLRSGVLVVVMFMAVVLVAIGARGTFIL